MGRQAVTTSDVNQILQRLAVIETRITDIAKDNEDADKVHERIDRRLSTVEKAMWTLGGGLLFGGTGLAALAARVLGS